MSKGKAFAKIVTFLTLSLIKTGHADILIQLMLNHVRLFVLGKFRYWGNRDFYTEIRLWNNIFGIITVDRRWIKRYGLEYPKDIDRFIDLLNAKFHVHKPKVLEVGSGPISRLTEGTPKFELYCLDPLAREYVRLQRMTRSKVDFKFVEGTCEELDSIFREESFHLVYASNSLDHTDNPVICIRRMFDVLKTYGILFVESHEREGTHHDWYGLHQHDLIPASPNLCLGTKDGKMQNITEDLLLKQIHFQRKPEQRYFAIAWQKIPSKNGE